MRLRTIQLENFRNHRSLVFEPTDGINLLYGPNGSGKTSVLEAIHYCALTKGFVTSSESDCLRFGEDYFLLKAVFCDSNEKGLGVKFSYTKSGGKVLRVNNSEVRPFSGHIGSVPCITFSPPEMVIVSGSPAERRRFADNALCQSERRYLDDLIQYRKVLQQRNALLSSPVCTSSLLDPWTESLALLAASLTLFRVKFIADLCGYASGIHPALSNGSNPEIVYRASLGEVDASSTREELVERYLAQFSRIGEQELLRRQTLLGPHRDEFVFLADGREIRKFASQGQLRTFLITLKLSLFRYFTQKLPSQPVCLFDDLFSELDAMRSEAVLSILEEAGQTIITATEGRHMEHVALHSVEKLSTTLQES